MQPDETLLSAVYGAQEQHSSGFIYTDIFLVGIWNKFFYNTEMLPSQCHQVQFQSKRTEIQMSASREECDLNASTVILILHFQSTDEVE